MFQEDQHKKDGMFAAMFLSNARPPPNIMAGNSNEHKTKRLVIVSWNVNSLRTLVASLPKTASGRMTLAEYFEDTFPGAVLICFQVGPALLGWGCSNHERTQEHKYAALKDVPEAVALLPGWESFWSFSGTGYSGVVTFARKGCVLCCLSASTHHSTL